MASHEELESIEAAAIERGANSSKRGQTVAINAHVALELVQMSRLYLFLESRARQIDFDGGNFGSWQIMGIPAYSNQVDRKYNYRTFAAAVLVEMKAEK
ncbi:hypothetical protein HNQ50_000795 [Silvimonas terrae]|uniref:Uncharacterized protein n=1 Tax=Silvimonas terrae TaxID=300266 RepID=A0A840R9Q1_9NEIS|nr:hypothetical protein [Silvimonas terrae]MBB5190085.1 hypothetical protein [Silvimonas terrae]